MLEALDRSIIKSTLLTVLAIYFLSLVEVLLIIPVAIALNKTNGSELTDIELKIIEFVSLGSAEEFSVFISNSIICVIFGSILAVSSQSIFQHYVWKTHNILLNRLYSCYINSKKWRKIKSNYSGMKKNLASETQNVAVYFLGPLCNIIGKFGFLITLIIAVCFLYGVEVSILFILMILTILAVFLYFFYICFKKAGTMREIAAEGIFSSLDEGLHNAPVMQILKKVKFFSDRMVVHSNRFFRITIAHAIIPQLPKYLLELAVFLLILLSIQDQSLSPLYFYFVVGFLKLAPTINILIKNFSDVGYGLSAFRKINSEFIEYEQAAHKLESFQLKSLNFEFYSKKNNVSFSLNPGCLVLIKGDSGSGKTSLIESLIGIEENIYTVKLNGEDFFGLIEFSNIGYLPQDVFLLNGGIEENVAFSKDIEFDDAHLLNILNELGLDRLDDQRILSTFGSGLSGGERQRIGMARCLYSNAELIILDEPTSALDDKNTTNIVDMLRSLKASNRAFIVVTHSDKLDAIADSIVNLE